MYEIYICDRGHEHLFFTASEIIILSVELCINSQDDDDGQ